MGTACCIKPPTKHLFDLVELEEIYVANEQMPYPESAALLATKRTSEPSLLPLSNEITNAINNFQRCNGKISSSFTRTTNILNNLSFAHKLRYQQQELSDIFKMSRLADKKYIKNNMVQKQKEKEKEKGREKEKEKQRIEPLSVIKQSRQNQSKKQPLLNPIQKQLFLPNHNPIEKLQNKYSQNIKPSPSPSPSHYQHLPSQNQNPKPKNQIQEIPKIKLKTQSAKNLSDDLSGSCSWEQQNQNQDNSIDDSCLQNQSNLLEDSIINNEVGEKKMELIKKYNRIQNVEFIEWSNLEFDRFMVQVGDLLKCRFREEFSAALSSVMVYFKKFGIYLCEFKRVEGGAYVKIHINGQKRLIKVCTETLSTTNPLEIFNKALFDLYQGSDISTTPCNEVYHLSGWVPEVLYLHEIQNKQNLWDRLVQNFNDGNIVITFGSVTEQNYMTLQSINTQTSNLNLICTVTKNQQNYLQMIQLPWAEVLEKVGAIYINWNPSIYNYTKKIDSKWVSKVSPFENQSICLQNNPQYLIKIPKHSQDFQIRVFADRYINKFHQESRLCLKLFEYNGSRILSPHESVRSLEVQERQLISDVFIFEKSETADYFVLVVLSDDNEVYEDQEIGFSLLFLSFVDIEVKELPRRQILREDKKVSTITKSNIGYGLNSPDFFKNVQYSLRVSPGSWLQIQIQTTSSCEFTLILIEDKIAAMDLTKIDFQTILNESTMTEVFDQFGYLQKEVLNEHYILVISMTKCSEMCKLNINANTCSKLFKRDRELQSCYSAIEIQELEFQPKIISESNLKWRVMDPGPRKRLKHTSTQVVYHPASIFDEFLKNPHFIFELEKGVYQFHLVCENYRTQFYKFQHSEGEPPALSIAVLKNSDNNKGYKIVVDDAFYVPIGYGFWTPELALEEGRYTIVCARVEKAEARGKLKIRKF